MFLFIISGIVTFILYSIHNCHYPFYVKILCDIGVLVLTFTLSLTIYTSLLYDIVNTGDFNFIIILIILGLIITLIIVYMYMIIIDEYYNKTDISLITKTNILFILSRSLAVFGLEIFLIGMIGIGKYFNLL